MISRRHVARVVFAVALSALSFGSDPAAATQEHAARFYIFGQVNDPGAYPVKAGMSVGDAVDLAGGIAPRGGSAIEVIRIVNGEKQTTVVTFNDVVLANDSIVVK